ncbi:glycosyltransferase family 9 protein [Elusimicrobiota bacterium]
MTLIKGTEKILVIQFRPVGDVLLTTPVIEYLKKKFPEIEVSFLTYEHFYPVLQGNPFIDKVIKIKNVSKKGIINFLKYVVYRSSIIKAIRKEKFNIVMDYIGLPSSAIMTFLSGAQYRVGYGHHKGRGLLYNIKALRSTEVYTVSKKYDLVRALGIDIDAPVIDAKIYLTDKDKEYAEELFERYGLNSKFTVLFSPDSPRQYKKWDIESYGELGRILAERFKASILLLHGPGEKEYCKKLGDIIGEAAILLPDTGLLQAAAIMEKVSVAVFNCGGMKHISVAVKTPSITIFSKTSPVVWHPPGLKWALYIKKEYTLGDGSFGATPEDVIKKIEELVNNRSSCL